jgi:hypothetical protein
LNGATAKPCLASHRHIPAVTTDLPASDDVPAISSDPTRRTLSHGCASLPAGFGLGRPSKYSIRQKNVGMDR